MKKMVVIFVCLLMVGSVLAASAVVYAKKPENPGGGKPPKDEEKLAEGEETLITENPMWYRNDPRIFGDKIVWVDKYNDISYLYLYELPDGPPTVIHELEGSLRYPEIYGTNIVFKSQILGGNTYLYDLNTDYAYLIKENNNAPPDIYENRIVYFGINDIWMYDLGPNGEYGGGDDQEYQLPSGGDTSLLGPPRIFGNIIVWAEDDLTTTEEDFDIVIYDLGEDGIPGGTGDNSDTKAILERPRWQHDPAIYGNIIVWTDDRNTKGGGQGKNANSDIYMYDLGPDGKYGTGDDNGEYQLTSNKNSQYSPDIYGNIIVWQDNRNDHMDVYMYDLGPDGEYGTGDDGGEYRVTISEANQRYPRISENRIVYLDDRSPVGSDIYMFTLTQ